MPDLSDISAFGWLGYVGVAIAIAINYFPKAWKESRGEDRENERLLSALEDERNEHRDTKAALKEAHSQIFQQVADFARMNAENATLAERMSYMVRDQERMANTIKEQHEQITKLNDQVRNLQQTLDARG